MTIRTAPKPQQGITLVELLMSMTIAVIVLTVGVSGMTTLAKRHARAVEVNALVGHLNFARAQAIMRALNIRVCPIVPGHAHEGCSATPSDDAWSHGYAVVALDAAGRMTSVLRVQQQAAQWPSSATAPASSSKTMGRCRWAVAQAPAVCASAIQVPTASTPPAS